MRAHQIMTKDVVTVTPHTSIEDAAKIMLQTHISGLPVLDDTGKLVGVAYWKVTFSAAAKSAPDANGLPGFSSSSAPEKSGHGFRSRTRAQGRRRHDRGSGSTVDEETPLEDLVRLMEKKGSSGCPS